ncbi:HAD-IA family hydrolase [Roseitranquillus sediminis]|uniref:HAD-IA family hydrolase n=1 Tax=Roseitranquillus sediminis TaxID=2809051 RepID=UPI001D0C432D|nr:HAD-IA family hydrolase [Roseitranquillus sediminis]MBM9593107.1 HAD-IA family hydrolase [Roseitranquillus sediminis]
MARVVLDPAEFDGVLFDMDGVVTDTASLHERAWKQVLDPILTAASGPPFSHDDYRRYVDGRTRPDGACAILSSRAIEPTPLLDRIAREKNAVFQHLLIAEGAEVLPGAERLLDALRQAGVRAGLFTGSRNAERVLRNSGLGAAFLARVDGLVAEEEGLDGKPAPDMPLALARRLGVRPERSALFEDSEAGVLAGAAGGFRLVIGVAEGKDAERLRAAGAGMTVASLEEVAVRNEESGT